MNRHIIIIAALFLAGLASCTHKPTADEITEQLRECSRIYTSEYHVSKVIIHEDEKRIQGELAGFRVDFGIAGTERMIAIPIEGVLKGYVDLTDISTDNVELTEDNNLTVTLPEPKVALTSTTVRHENIQEDISLLRMGFDDKEVTKIQQQGRDSLIASIPSLGIIPQVRKSTERTLVALFQQLGFRKEQISIRFTGNTEHPTLSDVKRMLTDETKKKEANL